jgi:hypothetical protein
MAVAALAACGSGSNKLSAGEYISKADGICKDEVAKAPRPSVRPTPKDSERRAAFRERLHKRLMALKPPAALAGRVAEYNALTEQIIRGYRKGAGELARSELPALSRTNLELNQAIVKRSKVATQVGFKRCGQPSAAPGATSRAPLGTDPSIVARADEACKQADFSQYATAGRSGSTLQQAGKTLTALLPVVRRAQKQIKALKPPAKDKQAFDAFLAAFNHRVDLAVQRAAAASRNDRNAFSRLNIEALQTSQVEQAPATQLGFEVCGRLGPNGV